MRIHPFFCVKEMAMTKLVCEFSVISVSDFLRSYNPFKSHYSNYSVIPVKAYHSETMIQELRFSDYSETKWRRYVVTRACPGRLRG